MSSKHKHIKTQDEIMNTTQIVTTNDIQDLLKQLVSFSAICYVDDNGFIRDKMEDGEDKYVLLTTDDGVDKRVIIYSDNLTNYNNEIIFNPFTESAALTPDKELLYDKFINSSLSVFTTSLFKYIHNVVIEANSSPKQDKEVKKGKDKKTVQHKETLADIELLTPMLGLVDEKMLTELESVINNLSASKFLNIYYTRKSMSSKLYCALLNPDMVKAYPNIRKKTWDNWAKMIDIIFGDISKNYSITSDLIGCPHLDSTLKCLYELFVKAGDYYALVGVKLDTDTLRTHIEKLSIYRMKAQWLVQAVKAKAIPADVQKQPSIQMNIRPDIRIAPNVGTKPMLPQINQPTNQPASYGYPQGVPQQTAVPFNMVRNSTVGTPGMSRLPTLPSAPGAPSYGGYGAGMRIDMRR